MACIKMAGLLLLLVAAPALADVDAKNRPVSKVITLLKDMIGQLEKEAEEDEEVYETMGCWCETNDKEKTQSISDAEGRINDLTSAIEGHTGNSARLNTEIANLEKEVAANSQALDSATALRKKELAEFNEEEKASLQTISSLKSAVIALSKHHEASLLQATGDDKAEVKRIMAMVQQIVHKHSSLLADIITPKQRKTINAFVQAPADYFDAQPAFNQVPAHAPASGEIFGILKQMKETFETNLANSQREEMTSQKDFEDLKAAKESEISAGQSQLDTKTGELATTDEKNAQAKQDLEDTRATLAADTEFLASLKEQCQNVDQ